MSRSETRILMVCLGNICRSPSAEAVLREKLQEAGMAGRVTVDSAGTGDWHIGRAPDPRAIEAAEARDIAMDGMRARQVKRADFYDFDLILAMDAMNLSDLREMQPEDSRASLQLFLEYSAEAGLLEVPDPYYGDEADFDMVLDLCEDAADGLIHHLRQADR